MGTKATFFIIFFLVRMNTLYAHLRIIPPAFPFVAFGTQLRRSAAQSYPDSIEPWDDFIENVLAFPIDDQQQLFSDTAFVTPNQLQLNSEMEIQHAFFTNVIHPVVRGDAAIRIKMNQCVVGRKAFCDFRLHNCATHCRVIGEMKPNFIGYEDDDDDADLVGMWADQATGGIARVQRQIRQLFGYMVHERTRYGFLSMYNLTWFFCRAPNRVLRISPAIRIDNANPTVAQCIWYLLQRNDGFMAREPGQDLYFSGEGHPSNPESNLDDSTSDEADDPSLVRNVEPLSSSRPVTRSHKRARTESHGEEIPKLDAYDLQLADTEIVEPNSILRPVTFSPLDANGDRKPMDATAWMFPDSKMSWFALDLMSELQCFPKVLTQGRLPSGKIVIVTESVSPIPHNASLTTNEKVQALDRLRALFRAGYYLVDGISLKQLVYKMENGKRCVFLGDIFHSVREIAHKQDKTKCAAAFQKMLFGST